jgi:hypothetical protein
MGPAGLGRQYLAWLRARGPKGSIGNWEHLWQVGLGSVMSIPVRMNVYLVEAELVSYCAATYLRLKSLDLTILIDIKARLWHANFFGFVQG